MSDIHVHIKNLSKAIDSWLRPDNLDLKNAIEKTVEEGFFSFPDIKHRIRVLKSTLRKIDLETWAERSGLKYQSLINKNILCLHAGNIPLVGLQDLLAVALTGGQYNGKISKNDPYLLPTAIQKFEEYEMIEETQWSHNLQYFTEKKMDAILFAGSQDSAARVKSLLESLRMIQSDTPSLYRTAHYSIAFVEDNNPETMQDLTEAVFRYGGTGCRSVAIVVAPYHLNDEKCRFTDYVEAFWLRNPQMSQPNESLFYRYAYNKAIGIPQAWLNDFLIEENHSHPKQKFILYWVKGGINELSELTEKYKNGLQSVYSTSSFIGEEVSGYRIEPLSQAQEPPFWWKPDKIDTISWLQKKVADQ